MLCGIKPAIKIHSGDNCFDCVAQQGLFAPTTRQHLGPAQPQDGTQINLAGNICAGFLANQCIEARGQLSLGRGDINSKKRLGHHEAQHTVAQELKTLVVITIGRRARRMRH